MTRRTIVWGTEGRNVREAVKKWFTRHRLLRGRKHKWEEAIIRDTVLGPQTEPREARPRQSLRGRCAIYAETQTCQLIHSAIQMHREASHLRVSAKQERCGSKRRRQRASSKFSEKSRLVCLPPVWVLCDNKGFSVCKDSGRMLSVTNTTNKGRLKHKHPGPDVSTLSVYTGWRGNCQQKGV